MVASFPGCVGWPGNEVGAVGCIAGTGGATCMNRTDGNSGTLGTNSEVEITHDQSINMHEYNYI